MTVAELIEKLKELPQGAAVHCLTGGSTGAIGEKLVEVTRASIDDEDGYHVLIS